MPSHKKTTHTDILISGGGVPGITLACLLGHIGIDVTLIEKFPPPDLTDIRPDARTSALMQGSINIVSAASKTSWEAAQPYGAALRSLRIVDTHKKPPLSVDFKASEIGLAAFGMNMPNNILRAALWEDCQRSGTVRILSAGLESYTQDQAGLTVTLEDGTIISTALLVGADGRNSPTRQMAGIAHQSTDYGQKALTCLLRHSRPHDNISTEFHYQGGPFTLVPLTGNTSSLVFVDTDENIEQYMSMSRHALERLIQQKSQDHLGTIEMTGTPSSWPLISLKAQSLTAPRTALIAEAAHVIHPLGAQGLNLSMRDVAALAETLTDAMRLGQDPGNMAVLQQYERRRRHDIDTRLTGTDGLLKIVTARQPAIKSMHWLGLKAIDHLTPLRIKTMREGLAPTDHNSRLAAGGRL